MSTPLTSNKGSIAFIMSPLTPGPHPRSRTSAACGMSDRKPCFLPFWRMMRSIAVRRSFAHFNFVGPLDDWF